MRINNSGSYEYCRWMAKDSFTRVDFDHNIKNQSPLDYFQNSLKDIRTQLLNGHCPIGCQQCHVMENNSKVSGRQKQLLKVGVLDQYFEKSLASSPLRADLDHSYKNNGHTTRTVTDWQIDLGNYCNSACVFCAPDSSSRLALEHKKLGLIDKLPASSWCDDSELLDRFVKDLLYSTDLRYLHFIGGETLITPAFEKILQALVDNKVSKNITIGFTTNLTVWSDNIVELLKSFQQVNLGMSIESMTRVNNYVRWPSQIDLVKSLLDRWIQLAKQQNWLTQLRITPTCLSVHELITVYDYAWENNVSIESCNFISNPEFMRISVLPTNQREMISLRLQEWVEQHKTETDQQIINTRDPNTVKQQICQDAISYINYLDSSPDESHRMPELIAYLKKLESLRGNTILDFIPQYEQLFRTHGY
jgi:sulfatase maturation enzyme AslB (radical SAM superfamily)